MKTTKTIFALLLFALVGTGFSVTAQADDVEHVTVTNVSPEQTIATAKHQIYLIQTDPGYYYSGAWGVSHRVHDVKEQQAVIASAQRMPASVK